MTKVGRGGLTGGAGCTPPVDKICDYAYQKAPEVLELLVPACGLKGAASKTLGTALRAKSVRSLLDGRSPAGGCPPPAAGFHGLAAVSVKALEPEKV